MDLQAARYHLARHVFALALRPSWFLWHLALNPDDPAFRLDFERPLFTSAVELFRRDWENAARGIYPRELLLSPRWEQLRAAPTLLAEAPRIVRRRRRADFDAVPDAAEDADYPAYYRRTFHWQTDGWFSERSARLYDLGVEFLFLGTADPMRRMTLPPLVEALADRRRPRLLDLGCGTGHYLAQVHQSLPAARLYGLDLSPFYLRHAQGTLAHVPGVSLLVENAEDVPLASGTMDAVTAVFLFHELPKDARRRVMAEALRLLRPGGRFVVSDALQEVDATSPEVDYLVRWFPGTYHEPYFRGYARDDLAVALAETGFEVESAERHHVSKTVVARRPG